MFNPTTLTVKKTVPWSAAAHVYQHNQSDLAFLRRRAQGSANEQQYFTIPLENATISSMPRDPTDAVDHPDFAWVPYANDPEPPSPPSSGDIRRPIIVGGLWNGQDAPPATAEDQKRPPWVLVVWGKGYPQLNGGGDSFRLNGWGDPRVAVARWYLENAWPVKQAVSPQKAGGHNEYIPDDSPGWSAPRGSAGNPLHRKFSLF